VSRGGHDQVIEHGDAHELPDFAEPLGQVHVSVARFGIARGVRVASNQGVRSHANQGPEHFTRMNVDVRDAAEGHHLTV